ncbi:MAG: xylose isomerase, partial [Chloroflexi bacterium]|nr:xylose isomerase [Chloroflexota bacterium]MBN9393569.1 xylose isomerase [Chloroflexota bacterium]
AADAEIQGLLAEINGGDQTYGGLLGGKYSPEKAAKLSGTTFDVDKLASRGYKYEKLDQLTIELILGVR